VAGSAGSVRSTSGATTGKVQPQGRANPSAGTIRSHRPKAGGGSNFTQTMGRGIGRHGSLASNSTQAALSHGNEMTRSSLARSGARGGTGISSGVAAVTGNRTASHDAIGRGTATPRHQSALAVTGNL
jgi:hypothetical protein